jgi:hypothetical protein
MRLRRKQEAEPVEDVDVETVDELVAAPPGPAAGSGPVDLEDLDPEAEFIDLGSLLVQPPEGLELRLQVEEESGEVLAVLLVAEDGVAEVRAFAAGRNAEMWSEVRGEIAADSTRRGGTAVEQEGPFGTELYCEVPVLGPEGEELVQPSRVIGWSGARWFLRATIAGRPATDSEYAAPFEDAIRNLAVRRGTEAMAPGEALPLRLPPEAKRSGAEAAGQE